ADAVALPAVVDRQTELEAAVVRMVDVTGFADDGLKAVDPHGRDGGKALALANMGEALEQRLRQFAHGAEKAVVAGALRQRAVVILQLFAVARLDKAHRDRFAITGAEHIGILLEIVKPQPAHGSLPEGIFEKKLPAPLFERRRRLGCFSSPPEGF